VSRAVAILRLLGKAQHPLGVKAIADALDLVPSTCLHIIRVLVAEDLVKPEPGTKRYMLASGMIQLARSVLAGGGFAHLSQPSLDLLASAFGVTAMGVEITPKQTVVVLSISRSEQPFRVHTDVGSQFSTLVSATGRLIAAHSGATWKQLKTQFQAVVWAKLQGWAVDQDHFMRGITVVAVPLFAANGVLTHTLVAVGLTSQLNKAATTALAAAMLKEADRIGQSLID
jgi:DNA-binding IclR family transcriptional regulator